MPHGCLTECERTQVHPIDSSFKRAFQIEEVEVAFGLCAVLFKRAPGWVKRKGSNLLRQFSSRRNRENTPNFEQTNITNAVIEIVSQRTQQARQKRRTHPCSVLDDRVCELRLIVFMAAQRRNEFEPCLLRNKTEVDRFIETESIERASQGTLLHLARLIFTGKTRGRKLFTNLFVTRVSRNVLDEIFFLFHVDTPRRDFETERLV